MRLACLLAIVVVVSPAIARADIAPPAKAHLDAGLAQYKAGHYESAIGEFEAAYEIDPDPQLLFAWAQAERLADHCASAIPRYPKYIASKPSAEAADLANNGIALCEAKAQPGATCAAGERPVPWYKDPVGGAVVGGTIALGVGIGFLIASSGTSDRAGRAQTSAAFDDLIDRATL